MEKILVCFDGSEWSKKALNEAIKIAQKFGSHITVLSVVPKVCFLETGIDCTTVEAIFRAEVEGNLKIAEEILKEKEVRGQTLILDGNPADAIVEYAKNKGFDLIVIGSKGKDFTERTLFGSVAQKVTANSGCSVLVIK